MQRIRAYPDDDAPRLVFADWLDEQGDPAAALFECNWPWPRLDAESLAEGEDRRLRPGREHQRDRLVVRRCAPGSPFRRVDCALSPLRDPTALSSRLRGGGECRCPQFHPSRSRAIRRGTVATYLSARHRRNASGRVQTPLLSRLSALTIHASHAGEPLARAIARSEHLGGLKRLDLSRNRFDSDAAEHLAASPALAGLRELDLRRESPGRNRARAPGFAASCSGE